MKDKRVRYIRNIFTLDCIGRGIGLSHWDKDEFSEFVSTYEKKYGLKLLSEKEEVFILIEYNNIIWNYKIYYGSYKKKYKELKMEDERWTFLEKQVYSELKMMGLEELIDEVMFNLKNGFYYENKIKKDIQFKKYCVKDLEE